MKINFKQVILAATALVIGFSSCSKDEDQSSTGGDSMPNGVKTAATITLTQSGTTPFARATTEEATESEKKINTAKLLIFDTGKSFEQSVDLTVSNANASTTISTTTGTHYFYVVVNPTAEVNALISSFTQGGISVEGVKTSIANVAAISALTTDNNFFMTSIGNAIEKNLIQATAEQAENAGNANNIVIPVGRAVAKVTLSYNPKTSTGTLSEVGYKVHNNPNQMFLMTSFNGDQLLSPFYNAPSVVAVNYFNNPAYINAGASSVSYAMENSNATPKDGNATYLSIKGKYAPVKVYDKDGVEGVAAGNGTFFRIFVAGNWVDKFFNEDPTGGSVITALTDAQIVKFDAGVAYYRLFLNDNSQSGAVAKHTIKRNTFFKATITSLSGVGSNTEGGGNTDTEGEVINPIDPDQPVAADTQINANIEILPWTVVEQNGGI